jgi:Ca2+/Na+ antiporter
MFSFGIVVLVIVMAIAGIRKAQRAGTWRWSKFALTLGFMAVVCAIITAPVIFMDMNSHYFWPVYGACWVAALGLMVWFIIKARKWQLSDERTSPQADGNDRNDQQPPR